MGVCARAQVVSGLAKYIALDALVGKSVIVLCNLKPAKMRGVESAGLLAFASPSPSICLSLSSLFLSLCFFSLSCVCI